MGDGVGQIRTAVFTAAGTSRGVREGQQVDKREYWPGPVYEVKKKLGGAVSEATSHIRVRGRKAAARPSGVTPGPPPARKDDSDGPTWNGVGRKPNKG